MRRRRGSLGQAALELVGILPWLALLTVLAWQLLITAHGWLAAVSAARSGARAAEVGAPVARAARAVLPAALARSARVSERPGSRERRVEVVLRPPGLLPGVEALARVRGAAVVTLGGR
jgi:hypothetical protein